LRTLRSRYSSTIVGCCLIWNTNLEIACLRDLLLTRSLAHFGQGDILFLVLTFN